MSIDKGHRGSNAPARTGTHHCARSALREATPGRVILEPRTDTKAAKAGVLAPASVDGIEPERLSPAEPLGLPRPAKPR